MAVGSQVEVRLERIATGGESVGRLDDGRVIFVRGALPDEQVRVEITEEKKRFTRGVTLEVVEASPHRATPRCRHVRAQECGGCDWMHVTLDTQRDYKRAIVIEQLQRLGGIDAPIVSLVDSPRGHRTTARCAVLDGRAGYRRRRTDDSFVAGECGAVHPLAERLIVDGRYGDADEVTIRVAPSTGQSLIVTDGDPANVVVPAGTVVVSKGDPGAAAIVEQVAGRPWRVSALSFFQTSDIGADVLVSSVQRGLAGSEGSVVDLYAGVGLLGGGAAPDRLTAAVESNAAAVADLRHNLHDLGSADVLVEQARVEQWTPRPFDAVIADPARRGLGKAGARVVDQTSARRLVLVSCDPASLGRDTALLVEQGWRYDQGEVIDMFPDTSRIEVVSVFSR